MKNILFTLLFSLQFLFSFSQELNFEVRGKYTIPVKKEKLNEANLVGDFVSGYPVNWLTNYISVEILATCNGKLIKAMGADDELTNEQKNILKTVDLNSDIIVKAIYRYKNSVTNILDTREMKITLTLIPEIEAQYVGGYLLLKKYLHETVINEISKTSYKNFEKGIFIFTINENGKVENVKLSSSSGNSKTDKLLINAINKMPDWKPAQYLNGIKVKQHFQLNVGNDGC